MLDKNKLTLIIGAGGTIGTALHSKMLSEGYNTTTPNRDILDLFDSGGIYQWLDTYRPSYIINLAAVKTNIRLNRDIPFRIYANTVLMNTNLFQSIGDTGYRPEKILSVVCSCSYGDNQGVLVEDQFDSGQVHPSVEPHGYAKRNLYYLHNFSRRQYSLNSTLVCFNNVYGNCFDKDTNILTVNGYKNIKDLQVGEKIYSLNPDTNEIEITRIIQTHKENTKKWINFQSRKVDFKVTPDHNMYVALQSCHKYRKLTADYIYNNVGKNSYIHFSHHKPFYMDSNNYNIFSLKSYIDNNHIIKVSKVLDNNAPKSKLIPIEYNYKDVVEFIGWFISEGSLASKKRTQICIHQSKKVNPEYFNEIKNLLKRMDIEYGETDKQIYFTSRLWVNFIKDMIGTHNYNKGIPSFIFKEDFPYSLRKILFETLMKGGGDKRGGRYTTKSNKLSKDFRHLCFLLGKRTNISDFNKESIYRIFITNKTKKTSILTKKISSTDIDCEESYCITVEKNHLIYAGRNDKYNWIGQCDWEKPNTFKVCDSLIKKIVDARNNGEASVTLWGTGVAKREFIHVDDCVSGILHIMNTYNGDRLVNIGNGYDVSIKDLAEGIRIAVGYKGEIKFDKIHLDGQISKLLDSTFCREILKWEPTVSLAEGIDRTIRDYEQYLVEKNT